MKIKSYILSSILLGTFSAMQGADLSELKQRFFENNYYGSQAGKASLLEIAAGDYGDAAVIFLEEVYQGPPETKGSLHSRFPEANLRLSREMRGVAQAGLIALGNKDAQAALIAESQSEEKPIRINALSKAKMIQGDLGIQMLSYFIGDTDDQGEKPLGPLDWGAIKELGKRVEDSPMKIENIQDYQPYENGGRTAWLKWRYENFGPIPGREELFTQFAVADVADADAVEKPETVTKPEVSESIAPEIEKSTEAVTPKPTEEPVEKSSNWWLWLIGLLVVIGGLGFWAHLNRRS